MALPKLETPTYTLLMNFKLKLSLNIRKNALIIKKIIANKINIYASDNEEIRNSYFCEK